jgi:hypothetical protein
MPGRPSSRKIRRETHIVRSIIHNRKKKKKEVKGTDSIDFDDAHIVSIDVKVEHGQRAHVDDPKTVRASRDKVERRILVEAWKILTVLREIHNSGICIERDIP